MGDHSGRQRQFRLSKYDPVLRRSDGTFGGDEWTHFAQVGTKVSLADYERTEDKYVRCVMSLLETAGIERLRVESLQTPTDGSLDLSESDAVAVARLGDLIRALLRETVWCRLESNDAYLHIGWDFYVYVGIPLEEVPARAIAGEHGLFLEPMRSPYLEQR